MLCYRVHASPPPLSPPATLPSRFPSFMPLFYFAISFPHCLISCSFSIPCFGSISFMDATFGLSPLIVSLAAVLSPISDVSPSPPCPSSQRDDPEHLGARRRRTLPPPPHRWRYVFAIVKKCSVLHRSIIGPRVSPREADKFPWALIFSWAGSNFILNPTRKPVFVSFFIIFFFFDSKETLIIFNLRPMMDVAVDSLPSPAATLCFRRCSRRLPTTTITTLPFGYFRVTSRSLDWTRRARVFVSAMSNEVVPMTAPLEAPATSRNIERVGIVKQQLSMLVKESLELLFPDEVQPIVAACQAKFGDYQCNNAMVIWSQLKGKATQFKNPNSIGQAIAKNLPESEMIESTSVAGPGFVNIKLSNKWISKHIQNMLVNGIEQWAPILPVRQAVVDFSSPNIAKEMHVGHLRSTIIGDTLARMLEFSNVQVFRRNHVGDWGTQFGMLIEYLFEQFPNWEDAGDQAIGDLQAFYKASKKKFDDDPDFKARAQQAVVKLQSGEDKYRHAWQKICEISRKEFDLVYQRLKVQLEEKGESFYNPYIRGVLEEFERNNLIKESEGARVVEIDGYDIPLIVVKKDGGYNYASTDLACLWYRLEEEKAEWIIYVTDVGQQQHFDMFFSAARLIGWLPASKDAYPRACHVGFGLVLGSDGKRFRTRSSEVVRLVELLDEAKNRSKAELIKRLEDNGKITDWTDAELESTAEAVGYGAIKYADLKNNRLTNYTFSFDQMLNDKGNTAVYLLYAHARICSIINKSSKDIEELKKIGKIVLDHVDERALGLHLIQFAEIVEEACSNLLPNVLCEYLYNLSEMFTRFYTSCQVIGSEQEESRLLLCEATAIVMRKSFHLLGITPVYKI